MAEMGLDKDETGCHIEAYLEYGAGQPPYSILPQGWRRAAAIPALVPECLQSHHERQVPNDLLHQPIGLVLQRCDAAPRVAQQGNLSPGAPIIGFGVDGSMRCRTGAALTG